MFQTQAACPAPFTASTLCNTARSGSGPVSRRWLAVLGAAGVVGAVALMPHVSTPVQPGTAPGAVVMVQADDSVALRDRAEAMRQAMLGRPGVGAVSIEGLRQQALAVDYVPGRLARLGLRAGDLAAALPVDAAQSRPGHLAVRDLGDVQAVANLPVRAGGKVFRLGDVAMVSRLKLEPPVATMFEAGRPTARLITTQTR